MDRIFIAHNKAEPDAALQRMVQLFRNTIRAAGGDPDGAEIVLGRDDFAARAGHLGWEEWYRSVAVGLDDTGDPIFTMIVRPVRLEECIEANRSPLTLAGPTDFIATAGKATGAMLEQALEGGSRQVLWLGVSESHDDPKRPTELSLLPPDSICPNGILDAAHFAHPKDWFAGYHLRCLG